MSRRVPPMLLIGALLLGALGAGGQEPARDKDEPPLRLKKKKRPAEPGKAQQDKKEPDKKEPDKDKAKEKEDERLQPEDDGPGQADEDEKEILSRIGRNMRSAEDQLSNAELNEGLTQKQKDVLRDLDRLIRKSEQQQQQQQGGGSDNQPQNGQDDKGGAQQRRSQQKGSMARNSGRRSGSRRQRAGRQRQGGSRMGKGNRQQDDNPQPGAGGNQPGGGRTSPPGQRDLTAEMYKDDVWGHLPESLRAQMNAYANPRPFSPRYDELIKKYYRTLAEQGRKKGD
jgi:hypothetical protein